MPPADARLQVASARPDGTRRLALFSVSVEDRCVEFELDGIASWEALHPRDHLSADILSQIAAGQRDVGYLLSGYIEQNWAEGRTEPV